MAVEVEGAAFWVLPWVPGLYRLPFWGTLLPGGGSRHRDVSLALLLGTPQEGCRPACPLSVLPGHTRGASARDWHSTVSPCPHFHPSYLPVQEPGVEFEVLFPAQGLFGKGDLGLEATWQQKGRAGCSHLAARLWAGAASAGGQQTSSPQYLTC
uniref:Uncharacterized protein n=1 Tax=Malurus cyaneus samueli TaxID=2593467 RepID=A0A8C5U128_9PASS